MRVSQVSSAKSTSVVRAISLAIFVAALTLTARAQESAQVAATGMRPLMTEAVDETQLTTLKGNTHPLARPQFDLGTAPASLPMERMLLVLKRSPEQEFALRKLLDDQQDKHSTNYHRWMTPEQYGRQFGPSDADMQTITAWLQSHGFQVGSTKGRTVLEFSGSASQVQEAFHTTVHKYIVNGEQHWANANDPSIPTALTPAVAGVLTLHNFLKKSHVHWSTQRISGKIGPGKKPEMNFSDGTHGLGPYDYATIYNSPAFSGSISGTVPIGIVGRSNLYQGVSDVEDFRSTIFNLCCGGPQVILNGPDPGDLGGGEEAEATLDTTWAGAVAPGAGVSLIVSASTDTTDGVDLSEVYIIENNQYPIMSESFGSCEADMSSTEAAGISALAEQAAAQGITYFVSSGDDGAEGCDDQDTETVASGPISVSGLASTAFNVAVGGTVFNENGKTTYWSSSNTSTFESAVSYIPEDVWNDSCPQSTCGSSANIWAASGGVSTLVSKPSWQSTSVTGVPNDGARDVPDVSLSAASHDPYLLCLEGSCVPDGQGQFYIYFVWGTSASAPSFAGVMALVEQQNGERQGLANYVLYRLAQTENGTLSQCNGSSSSALPASTCIFNDVTVGSNAVPGEVNYGLSTADYQTGTGYDRATGLGSVNITNLISQWNSVTFNPTSTTLTATGQTQNITHGSPVTVNIAVTPNSGTGVPTGDVSVANDVGPVDNFPVGTFTLSNGTATGTVSDLPGGTYTIYARYAGDATYAPSLGNGPSVTVLPEKSTTTLTASTFDANGNFAPLGAGGTIPYGDMVYLHAMVTGASGQGTPTGNIVFNDNPAIPNSYPLSSDGSTVTPDGLFSLPVGAHSITASYSSDYSFKASTSSALAFSIVPTQTTVVVTPSASSVASGGSITLTANLTLGTAALPSFGNAPTGTVSFYSNGTLVGTPQAVTGTAGSGNLLSGAYTLTTGAAALITTALPNGQDSITAVYSGDSNYAVSPSSAAAVVSVGGTPDFTLPSGGLGTVTVTSPGGNGTVSLSLTPVAGFSGAVTFTCVSANLPSETTCTQGTIASGQTTGSMTVMTTAPHAMMQGTHREYYLALWSGPPLLAFFVIAVPRKRRALFLMLLVALGLLLLLPACGGGGGGGGNHDPGTPIGNYTVSVTASSGTLSHNTTFLLVVQ